MRSETNKTGAIGIAAVSWNGVEMRLTPCCTPSIQLESLFCERVFAHNDK